MIEINNLTKFKIDKKLFTGVAKKVLKGENRLIENLSVAFVGETEIQKLNKKYRGKNKPTDVLSFEQVSSFKFQASSSDLGEVIICPEVVKENAKKFGVTFKQESVKMLIHGILHLCGYDHEKSEAEAVKMEEREKKYLENYYLNNI